MERFNLYLGIIDCFSTEEIHSSAAGSHAHKKVVAKHVDSGSLQAPGCLNSLHA